MVQEKVYGICTMDFGKESPVEAEGKDKNMVQMDKRFGYTM